MTTLLLVIVIALAVALLGWRLCVVEWRVHALRTLTLSLRAEVSGVNGRLINAERQLQIVQRHMQTVVADALVAAGLDGDHPQ